MAEGTIEDTFYLVNESEEQVMLEVVMDSPAQTCTTTIDLENNVIEPGHAGSYAEKPLDTNISLIGKTIFIVTTVTNTSGMQAEAKMTVILKGGLSNRETPFSATIEESDSVNFKYICKFFKG